MHFIFRTYLQKACLCTESSKIRESVDIQTSSSLKSMDKHPEVKLMKMDVVTLPTPEVL